ncbi:MAG: leucine-rich repeat protein [Clostridiales bacterium]|nr:leucine-rich repeat protein [Clostridiales bacterium]
MKRKIAAALAALMLVSQPMYAAQTFAADDVILEEDLSEDTETEGSASDAAGSLQIDGIEVQDSSGSGQSEETEQDTDEAASEKADAGTSKDTETQTTETADGTTDETTAGTSAGTSGDTGAASDSDLGNETAPEVSVETDADTSEDTGTTSDIDSENETASEAAAETGTEAEAETAAETGTEMEADTSAGIDVTAGSDTENGTETGAGTTAETVAETDTGLSEDNGAAAGSDSENETAVDTTTDTTADTAADTETGIEEPADTPETVTLETEETVILLDEESGIAVISIDEMEAAEPMLVEEDTEAETDTAISWQDGNITAVLENGVLTLTGSGAMTDYTSSTYHNAPWYGYEMDKIVISEGITHVGDRSFAYCKAAEVSLPESLLTIGEYAFYGSETLTGISIPDAVTSIGDLAFAYCDVFSQITLGSGLQELGEFAIGRTAITTLVIPDSVTTLGRELCGGCEQLKSVTIGNGVKSLPQYVFYCCTSLKSVTLGSGVQTISSYAFSDCTSLASITLGGGVKTVEPYVFYGCDALTKVTIGDSVETLSTCTFAGCDALTTVKIGTGVTTLPSYLFYCCPSLTKVTLSTGLTTIKSYAFYECTALENLTVPSSVTEIEAAAFTTCSKLSVKTSGLVRIEDGSYYPMETVTLSGTYYYDQAYEVLKLVNKERTAAGLSKLTMDADLLEAAMKRAAETAISFSHTRPSGLTCFTVSDKAYGENIAYGQSTASAVMTAWMNSSGHKANILGSSYESIGIGCFSQNGTLYWVQLFGCDSAEKVTQPDNATKNVTVALEPGAFSNSLTLYSSASTTLTVGKSRSFTVYLNGVKVKASSFTWSCGSKATVTSSGKVTAQKPGTATVTAKSKLGTMSASATVTMELAACKISSLTNTSSGITVKWKQVTGASGYIVYRKTASAKSYTRLAKLSGATTLSYTDTKVKSNNGTTYYYKVVAYSGSKKGTGTAATTVRLTGTTLSSVKNTSSKKATVKWKTKTKVTGYQIQYSTSKTFASGNKKVTVSSASTASKILSSLTKNKTYYVRVRTYKKVNGTTYYSAWSSKKSVKITK